jgi:hypothetical protein
MQIQTSSKYYTPEEYLELEEKSEFENNINLLITSMLEMLKLAQLVAMDIQ